MTHDPADGPPTLPPGLETVRTDSGLEYLDVEAGSGKVAVEGKPVRVHFSVWLLDGTLVESSADRDGGAGYVPGAAEVIPALEEGVLGMRPGGRRRLIVPSDQAYGAEGLPGRVPPYATLIVDLELLTQR